MRASASTQLVREDGQKPTALILEHNYCAEHEWGVEKLRLKCGGMRTEDSDKHRICDFGRISVKVNPDDLLWYEEKGLAAIGVDNTRFRNWNFDEKDLKRYGIKVGDPVAKAWAASSFELGIPKKLTKKDLQSEWKPRQTHSAWDEASFGVVSRDPEIIEFLNLLKEALLSGDAVLHISGSNNPFKPVSGLVLGISSLISQEIKYSYHIGWEDVYKLRDAAQETGIEKRISRSDKRFYSLKPKWTLEIKSTKNGTIKTKHPVIFWLNPQEQHLYESGWYTVEQLDQWIKNEGIIMEVKP